jgi:hypothetical protein
MVGNDEDRGRTRRLSAEDRGWSSTGQILGGQIIKGSGDVVCSLHRAQIDEEHGFLGSASKPRSTVSPGDLNTGGYGSCGLATKPLARVSRFWPQNRQLRFGDLAHKITATIDWFGPQNQVGGGLSICTLKLMGG